MAGVPGGYAPVTLDYWLWWKLHCHEGSADDFQKLFENVIKRAQPEFMSIRPYGNIVDRKCNGLFFEAGTVFQVYSTDELKQAEVQAKIEEDLAGAVDHWRDKGLKRWVFVYNCRRGLPPDIPATLNAQRSKYPDITLDHIQLLERGLEEPRGVSVDRVEAGQNATRKVDEERIARDRFEAKDAKLAHRKQVDEQAHLGAHGVDDAEAGLEAVERRRQRLVDAERAEEGAKTDEAAETAEGGVGRADADGRRVRAADGSLALVAIAAPSAEDVPPVLVERLAARGARGKRGDDRREVRGVASPAARWRIGHLQGAWGGLWLGP